MLSIFLKILKKNRFKYILNSIIIISIGKILIWTKKSGGAIIKKIIKVIKYTYFLLFKISKDKNLDKRKNILIIKNEKWKNNKKSIKSLR